MPSFRSIILWIGRNSKREILENPKAERSPKVEIRRTPPFAVLFGFREAIAKVAPLWCSHDPFPLTPALSLREREHHRRRIRQQAPLGVVPTRSLGLPLPEGEGRGEGERA